MNKNLIIPVIVTNPSTSDAFASKIAFSFKYDETINCWTTSLESEFMNDVHLNFQNGIFKLDPDNMLEFRECVK
jgi:hypothetical protein